MQGLCVRTVVWQCAPWQRTVACDGNDCSELLSRPNVLFGVLQLVKRALPYGMSTLPRGVYANEDTGMHCLHGQGREGEDMIVGLGILSKAS